MMCITVFIRKLFIAMNRGPSPASVTSKKRISFFTPIKVAVFRLVVVNHALQILVARRPNDSRMTGVRGSSTSQMADLLPISCVILFVPLCLQIQ